MKRFEVTLTLKVGISAPNAIIAGNDVVKFIRNYMLLYNAEFDRFQNKNIVLETPTVGSENVKELPF